MTRYDPEPVLAELKPFQRDTVEHVVNRFYRDSKTTRRFLVADETGLGKSIVAKGVIARTIERLQDDRKTKRIDIVYVCSNADIARQNLSRLDVVGNAGRAINSRLTLLAKYSRRLATTPHTGRKPVNLVAFTPGTSFDRGHRTGQAEERALLVLVLESVLQLDARGRKAARRMLRGNVKSQPGFDKRVERLRTELDGPIDPAILSEFIKLLTPELKARVTSCLAAIGGKEKLATDIIHEALQLTGELRGLLAEASVQTLEPDLVILDEFQRFRHLLDIDDDNPSAELAHHLFDYGDTKVLLLSATPYKPFTLAEETDAGDDHHKDLRRVLEFLEPDEVWQASVETAFQDYRQALLLGTDASIAAMAIRTLLLRAMVRTERPRLGQDGMLREITLEAGPVTPADLRGWVALAALGRKLGAKAPLDYWKSAPYFVNFMDSYQIGDHLKSALQDQERRQSLRPLLGKAQSLKREDLLRFRTIDYGSGRLRKIAGRTVEHGWWKLLWMPPSMPYCELQQPFRNLTTTGMTKQLVFSSWNATPTAVAALLSYEADRRIAHSAGREVNSPTARKTTRARLDYPVSDDTARSMSTLTLFMPHPGLAALTDPLAQARSRPEQELTLRQLRAGMTALVRPRLNGLIRPDKSGPVELWRAWARLPGLVPDGLDETQAAEAIGGRRGNESGPQIDQARGVALHLARALAVSQTSDPVARRADDLLQDLVLLGSAAPGNIAWRSLGRLLAANNTVTPVGHWRASCALASGLRSLFNRGESQDLLDGLKFGKVYWRAVLRYCQSGDLQAVLDEYVHHLRSSGSSEPLDDESLMVLAEEIRDAVSLRPSTYQATDPYSDKPIGMLSRFALRYGGGSERDGADNVRPSEVRQAFNSPFWPFVLTTTSAGQEGIDFHWWCASVVHWNLPANPVDFEQREGRVHRFGGHAVRLNVSQHHRADALTSGDRDPWKAAYDAALSKPVANLGTFAPYWVYPGDAKVERILLPYPLSNDIPRAENLKASLALYRLAFGQPRQEDLVELLRRPGTSANRVALDLQPPKLAAPAEQKSRSGY